MAKNMIRRPFPRGGIRTRLPVTIYRRSSDEFSPTEISGLALWLDASSDTLYTTDAGPVVAVASPLDIAGCVGWWDASDAASITASGGLVSQINDKSGLLAHASQGTSGAQPTLVASALNGRSVLRFDGGDALTGNFAATISTNAYSVFVVCKMTSVITNGRVFSVASAAGADYASGMMIPCCVNGSTTNQLSAFDGASGANKGAVEGFGSYAVFSGTVGSSSVTNASNGMRVASAAVTLSTAVDRFGIGAPAMGGAGGWVGDIAEVIYYSAAITTADRARVEAYLAAKWSISGVHAPATASSDPVGYWGDKSGNGRHLTQATANLRGLVFTASGRTRVDIPATLNSGFSSATPTTSSTGTVIQAARFAGNPNWLTILRGDGSAFVDAASSGSGAAPPDAAGTPSFFVQGSPVASTRGTLYSGLNDVNAVFTATNINFSTWSSGWRWYNFGSSFQFIGEVGEVLVYNRALTTTERQRAERYLASKWGITLAPQVANADAQNWIDRVYQNGGSVSSATAASVNQLCDSLDAASLRDRFYRLNLFCGSNLNAALVPLYRGPSLGGTQYGSTTDTNNAFVGVGTDYAETGATGGLTGNGTTKYLNTGFNVDQLPGAANCHLSSFITGTQDIAAVRTLVGTIFNSVTDRYRLFLRTDSSTPPNYTLQVDLGKSEGVTQINRTNTSGGLLVGSRTSTTNLSLYAGGVSAAATNTNPTAETTGASPFFVFARNGPTEFYNGRMAAYSIGAGMTAAQVTAYNTAIQAFQTTMGRA